MVIYFIHKYVLAFHPLNVPQCELCYLQKNKSPFSFCGKKLPRHTFAAVLNHVFMEI